VDSGLAGGTPSWFVVAAAARREEEEGEEDLIATSPAPLLPETTALAASGVEAAAGATVAAAAEEELDPEDAGKGEGGWRLARATTRWPFARQWRSEKKLSLPPDTSAITFSPDDEVGAAAGAILVGVWTRDVSM
jgi:hypothetical protein